MNQDFMSELPERSRNDPTWQLLGEMLRLLPELREEYMKEGSGGFTLGVRRDEMAQAVAALRRLPDDAGPAAVTSALAPFLEPGKS